MVKSIREDISKITFVDKMTKANNIPLPHFLKDLKDLFGDAEAYGVVLTDTKDKPVTFEQLWTYLDNYDFIVYRIALHNGFVYELVSRLVKSKQLVYSMRIRLK